MTLVYKPIDAGHVPAHIRNAFAERFPSNPPKDEPPAPGWHWYEVTGAYWLRKPDGRWYVATVEI